MIIPATLGWSNPENADNENFRLYALDAGPSPRWQNPPFGRTVEVAIREGSEPTHEGDRFLVVRVGSRPVDDEWLDAVATRIEALLQEEDL